MKRPMKVVIAGVLAACVALAVSAQSRMGTETHAARVADTGAGAANLAVATFAAGCFWCTESDFDKVPGVVKTISGFMGGKTKNPTYEEVSAHVTGHAEAVQVSYDPSKVTYEKLLDHYWRNVDATDGGGQFCDRGDSYRPVIFTHTEEQRAAAEASKAALGEGGRFKKPIAVEIQKASDFTAADDWHQDYYKKNPFRYKVYRHGCGRDARLKAIWGN